MHLEKETTVRLVAHLMKMELAALTRVHCADGLPAT